MLLSHRKKFIFTKTLKTAGTSVESYYEPLCMPKGQWTQSHKRDEYISDTGIIGCRGRRPQNNTYYNHMPAFMIRDLIGQDMWDSYFKFTVVRNPFGKLVSGWYYVNKDKIDSKKNTSRQEIDDFRQWLLYGGRMIDRDKYLIDNIECMDFFIRYEALLSDLEIVNKKLGVDSSELVLPNFKAGLRNNNIGVRDFYNSQTEKLVRKIYKWEFERFEYEMPL